MHPTLGTLHLQWSAQLRNAPLTSWAATELH